MLEDVWRQNDDGSIDLFVHAQPGAGRSAFVGRHGESLKVRVAAPPEGGRANEALTKLLSESFGVPAKQLELTAGDHSRTKRFRITGIEPDEFSRLLEAAVDAGNAPRSPGSRDRRR